MAFYKYSAPSNTFKAIGSAGVAGEISFDNRESGLEATNVQGAIDEVDNNLNEVRGVHQDTSRAYLKGDSIELRGFPVSYIDFKYNNSDVDFTSRIIEVASGILHAEQLFRTKDITDANDAPAGISCIPSSGLAGIANSPFDFWSTLLTICMSDEKYRQQIAFPWGGATLRLAYRVKDYDVWNPWHYINFDS